MTKKKCSVWPWHLLTGLVLLVLVWVLWFSTSPISYEWHWNRVPQCFAYQAEKPSRANEIGRVEAIEEQGKDARATLPGESGEKQVVIVAQDSLQFFEGDDVVEGNAVGVTRHWIVGLLLWGLWATLWPSLVSGAIGLAISLVAGLYRSSKSPTLHDLSVIYVELVCGTPLLVQILIFHSSIDIVLNLSREFAGVAVLVPFTGAYMAEIIRTDVQSIVRGQNEAARSLGLNADQSTRYVILPQAFKRVLPPLVGQSISLVRDTSLVSVIAVTELTKSGREAITTSFSAFRIRFCVAALYLLLNLPFSYMASRLERRLGQSD